MARGGTSLAAAKSRLRTSMFDSFLQSTHMPCAECGASVAVSERDAHTCDPGRLLEYRMFQLRGEVSGFEERLRRYLDSPHGRFAQWLAERQRRERGR